MHGNGVFYGKYLSPLGPMVMAGEGEALTGLWFEGQTYFDEACLMEGRQGNLQVFREACRWLEVYFSGRQPDFVPGILLKGTAFRQAVWQVLLNIPYGETMTYGEIAALLAEERGVSRLSAQAVGGAVGHNPIAIIVPCHRVIGKGGKLTGYAGGIDRKEWLLNLEHAHRIFPRRASTPSQAARTWPIYADEDIPLELAASRRK